MRQLLYPAFFMGILVLGVHSTWKRSLDPSIPHFDTLVDLNDHFAKRDVKPAWEHVDDNGAVFVEDEKLGQTKKRTDWGAEHFDLFDGGADDHHLRVRRGDSASEISVEDFKSNFKFCYKWKVQNSDTEEGQCGGEGKKEGEECAKVGEWTPEYLDDTSSKKGGCEIQWRLTYEIEDPQSMPEWLKAVMLCFVWESHDKNITGECGDGVTAGDMYCEKLGTWTTAYLDNTHQGGSGCFQTWWIEIPQCRAPNYMNYLKLCFESKFSKSDEHNLQCHRYTGHTCSYANSLAQLYYDDTDDREGGCNLKWGVFLDV